MKKKISLLFALFLLIAASLSAQTSYFYYYKGEKINVMLNRNFLNIIIDEKFQESEISKDFIIHYYEHDPVKEFIKLEFIKTPNAIEYETIINDLKQNRQIKYAFPFFGDTTSIGTSDKFYIKLKQIEDTTLLKNLTIQQNVQILRQVLYMPLWHVLSIQNSGFNNSLEATNYFYETGYIENIDPAFMFNFKPACSDDPDFSQLWGLQNTSNPGIDINVCNTWTITRGAGINVAVVDDPMDREHRDLVDNMHSLYFNTDGVIGVSWHGTHVAGIIAAVKDNNLDVVGVAPESKIMGVSNGLGDVSEELASGISWAWKHGADVINNSWGVNCYYSLYIPVLEEAIIDAMTEGRDGKGCVVIFATGNDATDLEYPGNFHDDILTVGSIDYLGIRAPNANYGNKLDVVAPGVSILSTAAFPFGITRIASGTSMAAPHVSGIAALILSVNPDLTGQQVRDIIESTAKKIRTDVYSYETEPERPNGVWNYELGYGLVDAYAAVLAVECDRGLPVVHGTITENTIWDAPVYAINTITIPDGVTLTIESKVECNATVSFIVLPGGKLIIDGGTLTNACEHKMWQGIYVVGNANLPQTPQNQGVLELNSGTIENAINAIATYNLAPNGTVDYATTGGIIEANTVIFKNNRRSAEFSIYPASGSNLIPDNVSYFANCTFVVDDNNLFASNNTDFLSHITMWEVSGVGIVSCTFENNITRMIDRRQAIYTLDAGYTIDEGCSAYSLQTCLCIHQPIPSVFKGFNRAIESSNSATQYAITIDRSTFENNITGVHLSGINNPQVSRLNIALDHKNNPTGIYLDNCTGYKIEGNMIYSSNNKSFPTGIWVHNTGTDENLIYRNQISSTYRGIRVTGATRGGGRYPQPTGLLFGCHDFSDNYYDIVVEDPGKIRTVQGFVPLLGNIIGVDNLFSKSGTHHLNVHASHIRVHYYYDSSVPRKEPVNRTNNVSIYSAGANRCMNTLCGVGQRSSESLLTEYRELNQTYIEMMSYFHDSGYAELLDNPSTGTMEDEASLAEATAYRNEILALTEYMAEISKKALFTLKTDSIIDLTQIRDWYDAMYNLSAKYSLAETYYRLGRYEEGFNTLRLIPTMFNLNENEIIEHRNYVSLFTFKNEIRESGRNIAQLTEAEIERMRYFAEVSHGLSALMARNILCFFYEICLEEEEAAATGNTGEMARGSEDDITDLRESASSASSAFQKPALENITLHPNPTTGELTITNNGLQITNIEIFDAYGRKLQAENGKQNKINISHLNSGIYFVKISTDAGEVVKKIIKQ